MLNLEKIMFLKVLSYPERVFSMQLFSIAYGQPHVEANSSAIFAEKRKMMIRKKNNLETLFSIYLSTYSINQTVWHCKQ